RRIVERAGGIPLFIEELARSVAAARHQEHLPLRLQELLAARLRAPGIDLRLAQLAATFGPVFDRALLAQLASIPVDRGLADLEAAGIVEPLGDPSGRAYQFSHVLLRDAAYETQVLEVRRDAHRRIARMLQAALEPSPGDAAVTAQHLDLAGEVTEAVSTYVQAAQQAQVVASHLEARRLLSRALELLATTPEGESREITEIMVRMLRALSVVSVFGYPHPEVLEDCEAANELCRRHKDRPEVMPAEVGIWSYFFARAEHRIARAVIQRVAERIEVPQGAWFTPEVKSCLGFDLLYAGELLQARTVLDESWSGFMARPPEERVWSLWRLSYDPVALVATGLACLDALQGRSAHSEIWTARAIERAEGLGRQGAFTLGFVTLYLAWLRMVMGDPAGSYRYGCQTIEIGERYGFDYWAVLGRPFVLISEPGVPMHPELMDRIEADMDAIGHWAFRPAYLGNEARARALLGDLPGALETVEQALALNQKLEEWIHQPDLLRLRAELRALADGGRMGEVVDDLHSAVEAGMSQGSLALAL
ncbi:MAG TPA: hypothetical protein VGA71_06560, partial [Actinomycetota bacterium]